MVAVVDDEAPVVTMLGRLLRLAGYRVTAFSSGEAFEASLALQRPACAILDIHLPGLSGLDVHARMRAAQLSIPVVFITASDDNTLLDAARDSGAVALLRKPFSSDDLLAAIGVAISGSDLRG